jgi:ceramide glucosyltransferase
MNGSVDVAFAVIEWVTLIPVICGSAFAVLCLVAVVLGLRRPAILQLPDGELPAVTVLKPVCGLEKGLEENLHSICRQDYPCYQVVLSVQHPADEAIPLLESLRDRYGPERVTVVVDQVRAGLNGKINNMLGGIKAARHDVLVISDSDVKLGPDYLRAIVSPLSDAAVGAACTLFRATRAGTWYEKLELLNINADFMPSVVFAHYTGASGFCLGPSIALRRSTLEAMGGFESLADYLVEDYEIGRRVWTSRKRMELVPYVIDKVVDLASPLAWWHHQVYWDQNTRSARPFAFFATIVTRAVPFALIYAALRGFDVTGVGVFLSTTAVRLVTGAGTVWGLRDREGLAAIWLLPIRDIAGLVSFVLAFTKRTVVWRGQEFVLTRHGRLARIDETAGRAEAGADGPAGAESDEGGRGKKSGPLAHRERWKSVAAMIVSLFVR